MKILNLTQHAATVEQVAQGVIDLTGDDLATMKALLTFVGLPSAETVHERAYEVAKLAQAHDVESVMIGGAPFFMGALERALQKRGIKPLYAFSERVSVEKVIDCVVVKTNEFKHMGFVEVWL